MGVGGRRLHVAGGRAPSQFLDANPPGDDRQISGQAARPTELPQHGVIIGDDLQHHFGGQVFHVFRPQWRTAQVGGVMDDVINEAEEAIDEIIPGAGMTAETALE